MRTAPNHSTGIPEEMRSLHHAFIPKQISQPSVKGCEGANDVQYFEMGELRLRLFRIEYRLDYLHTREEVLEAKEYCKITNFITCAPHQKIIEVMG